MFRSECQGELVVRLNNAITELADGEYIAIHHSSHFWQSDKLEKQVAFLGAYPDIGAVFTNATTAPEILFPLSREDNFSSVNFSICNRTRHEWLHGFFSGGNLLCHPSVLIRKKCYEDCGTYRHDLAQLSDLDMWIRLCMKYEIHVLPEKLVKFRVCANAANTASKLSEARIRLGYEFYKLLQNYRKIPSFEDLIKIFPSADRFYRDKETDIDFALAMVALEEKPFAFVGLFGLDLLHEALSDKKRAVAIKRLYNFDYKGFISLSGKHDVFSQEEVVKLNATIKRIYSSYSWRLTRPLRSLAIRKKYCQWKIDTTSRFEAISNSADNLLALQALTIRRFNKQAWLNVINVASVDWPEIDVSVVTHNSSRWIRPFVTSLVAQRYPLSKIHLRIVDNGSKDDTVFQLDELLTEMGSNFASIRIIQQTNLGFGAGHDRAIKEGNSEYCLVSHPDLEFEPSALYNIVRLALSDKDGEVASWELRQIPYENTKYYDPITLETNWSSHACILIRRSAYIKVGGYDPYIFMCAEDVELSYRFRSYGYVLKYIPIAVVKHFAYEGTRKISPLQFFGSVLGNIYIRLRYGKTSDRFAGLLLYVVCIYSSSPFKGSKTFLLKNTFKLFAQYAHFLRGKGPALAYFPLRKVEYDLAREGACWEIQPRPAVTPLVTVITRTYLGRDMFLEQAIQSVFNQTHQAIELIVVEDGGESQQTLVTSLSERTISTGCRVRFLSNGKLGRSAAGNAALSEAQGRFIMFLDDDDLLFPDHIETLVSVLSRDAKLAAAYSLAFEVHTNVNSIISAYTEYSLSVPAYLQQKWDYQVLQRRNFIPIQSLLFKRELYEKRGGFDTELDQMEDWNLWLRYGYANQFAYIPKTTSMFRVPADDRSRHIRHAQLQASVVDAKWRAISSLERLGLRSTSPQP